MAENNTFFNAEILEAAIPYVPPRHKPVIELFAKGIDLIQCINKLDKGSLTASSFEKEEFNFDSLEALLSGVRPACNEKQRSYIDKILSIFDAKRIFEMFNSYMSVMETMDGFGDDGNSNFSNEGMMEMLKTMIPPEQQDTIENLSMILNSASYDNNDNEDEADEKDEE